MIYIVNFTRKFITCLNMLCLLLPNGLIQLNGISAGKPVMFVHFVVCLFAYNDRWKFFKKSPLKIVGSPCPWLVSGLLSSFIYGIYCNVYTVQCNVSTYSSLFVWLSRLAKPKLKLSLNEIFNTKLSL